MPAARSDLPAFGTLLRLHRRGAGLSQAELAERAGYSRDYVSMLERGVRFCPLPVAALLAHILTLGASEQETLLEAARHGLERTQSAAMVQGATVDAPPVPSMPCIGRADELASVERHLSERSTPLLLLSGEPGIGKTRLLREAAEQARSRGFTVLEGATPREGAEPLAVFVQALGRSIQRQSDERRVELLRGATWLVRLLPELVELGLTPPPPLSPEQENRQIVRAVARFLANLARVSGSCGTLLVLDDLQWASVEALDRLEALVSEVGELNTSGPSQMRFLGAYRHTTIQYDSRLARLVPDLVQANLARRQTLGPLSRDASVRLLEVLLDASPDVSPLPCPLSADSRARLIERADGVPLYLVAFAHAVQQCHDGVESDAQPPLPQELAESICQRIMEIPPAARSLLGVMAAVGGEVPRWLTIVLAQKVLGHSEHVTLDGVAQAEHAELLAQDGLRAYRFTHMVIREVIEWHTPIGHRAMLHRQVLEALEGCEEPVPVQQLAAHARLSDDSEKTVYYLEAAGDEARAQHAEAIAVEDYSALVTILESLDRPPTLARTLLKLGRTLALARRSAEARAALERATTLFRSLGDRAGEADARAALYHLLSANGGHGHDPQECTSSSSQSCS